jgi:hypothetical protein
VNTGGGPPPDYATTEVGPVRSVIQQGVHVGPEWFDNKGARPEDLEWAHMCDFTGVRGSQGGEPTPRRATRSIASV